MYIFFFLETDLTVLGYPNGALVIASASRLPRKSAPKTWIQNVRKQLRLSGQAYKNRKGENVPCKSVTTRKDCLNSCKFKCRQHISDEERAHIFPDFWCMDDTQNYFIIVF